MLQAERQQSSGNAVLQLDLLQIQATAEEVCGLDLHKLGAIWKVRVLEQESYAAFFYRLWVSI